MTRTIYTATLVDHDSGADLPDTATAHTRDYAFEKGLDLIRVVARAEGQTYSRVLRLPYVWRGDLNHRVLTVVVTKSEVDRNPHEDDKPDAMNQGVHIAMASYKVIQCDCGALVAEWDWERHCESEGE